MDQLLWLRFAHFAGWMLWVSGIAGMAFALMAGARSKAAGRLADVGAALAIGTGVYSGLTQGAFKHGWLHLKLVFVLALIIVNAALRVRTRKGVSQGAAGLLAAALIAALLVLLAAVVRPFGS